MRNLTHRYFSFYSDITVDMDDETFIQLGDKQISLADAEADGKASVSGNRSILAALTEAMK